MASNIGCPDWQTGLPDGQRDETEYFWCDNCGYEEESPIEDGDGDEN
jgi:hypothetical protein